MTTGAAGTRADLLVQRATTVDEGLGDELWHLYRSAFEDLRDVAASRHILTRAEFDLEALDSRVTKYIVRLDGRVVGLCAVTTDLTTVPWVSPEYYARRYPEQSSRSAVFYCSLAMVAPDARRSAALVRMVEAFGTDIALSDGVLVADMCRFNIDVVELHRIVGSVLQRVWGRVDLVELDRQVFLAWEPPSRPTERRPGAQPSGAAHRRERTLRDATREDHRHDATA